MEMCVWNVVHCCTRSYFSFYSSSKLYLLGPTNLPDPITCFKFFSSLLQFESFPLIFIYLNHRRCWNEGFFLQIHIGSQCHLPLQLTRPPILNMKSILAVFHRWSLGSYLDEAQQFLHCLSKLYFLNTECVSFTSLLWFSLSREIKYLLCISTFIGQGYWHFRNTFSGV